MPGRSPMPKPASIACPAPQTGADLSGSAPTRPTNARLRPMPDSFDSAAIETADPDCSGTADLPRRARPAAREAAGGSGVVRVGARAHYAVVAMVELARRR